MGKKQQRSLASCQCEQSAVEVIGGPILSVVCMCQNCRTAAHAFGRVEGAPRTVGAEGGVEYCLFRKDRVAITRGNEFLQEHRLTPDSKIRRVVATCCNSPMFLDFTQGHWLSVYRSRLPAGAQPPQMLIVTSERPIDVNLPNDIPNYPGHPPVFMIRLLFSWVAMGFRRPKVVW